MAKGSKEWYAEWFNTPYYHILYKHRNDEEAEHFINALIAHLSPPAHASVLDLACGKGRHARMLAEKPLQVTGMDLSPASIEEAKTYEKENLRFVTGDMREPFGEAEYDYIFNLFTSFGYFENEEDNLAVLHRAYSALKPGGLLVIDFLNSYKAARELVEKEVVKRDGYTFEIKRGIKGKHIVKTISFMDGETFMEFQERVQGLRREDFIKLLKETGFHLRETFGNYSLDYYSKNTSPRLILIAERR